jgi:hypothetical protein
MSDTYTADTPEEAAPAPVADEPKKYTGDLHGIQEAAADHQRDRDEKKKAAPTPDRVAKAKQKLADRVAEKMGAESVDLDMITYRSDEPLKERQAAKGLAEFRRQKEAGLQEILREEDAASEVERESAKQEAEWTAQVEAAAQQERAAEEHQRQQQASEQTRQLSETEYALRGRLQQYQAAALAELPELPQLLQLAQTNPAQAQQIWAAFAARDPAKAARIAQLDSAFRADAAQAELASVHQHQQQQRAFHEYGRAQDEKFKAAHPELADRRAMFDLGQDAVEVLKAQGLSEDRLRDLWNTSPEFRSAEAQALVYAAVKNWRAEKAMREARPVAAPQPQRPGVSTGRVGQNGTSSENTLRAIDAAPTLRKQLAAATEVTMARRRAQAKGRR